MADIWFFRLIFALSLILGVVIPASNLIRLVLIKGGIDGLLIEERISKEKLDLEQQKALRELEQSTKPGPGPHGENVEASNVCRDLTLPADPGEGY